MIEIIRGIIFAVSVGFMLIAPAMILKILWREL